MLAATLICGASVFTSCSESGDNPAPENAKNRKEFIKHTRENLKDLAENLNFRSWEVANKINQEFNTTVLNNPQFEKAILPLFTEKSRESIQPVEEGSELAAMGYKQVATLDLTKFNYRFTMKEDGSGFDVEEADDFEMMCAYSGYIDFMIEDGDFEGAYSLLKEGRQYFSEYGRSAWQAGVRLMEALPGKASEIWDFILPHIRTDLKNDMIAPVEAERVMRCADMMGAHDIAKAVKVSYDKTMAEIEKRKAGKMRVDETCG